MFSTCPNSGCTADTLLLAQVSPEEETTASRKEGEWDSAEDKDSLDRSWPPRPTISETEELDEEKQEVGVGTLAREALEEVLAA